MCWIMGSFEIFHFWFFINLFVTLVIAVLSIFSFKNLLNRFGLLHISRRSFYECGFKPVVQKPFQMSIQFVFVAIFFILYDIELVFSFPLISSFSNHMFMELLAFGFLYGSLILSLLFDYDRFLTIWKF